MCWDSLHYPWGIRSYVSPKTLQGARVPLALHTRGQRPAHGQRPLPWQLCVVLTLPSAGGPRRTRGTPETSVTGQGVRQRNGREWQFGRPLASRIGHADLSCGMCGYMSPLSIYVFVAHKLALNTRTPWSQDRGPNKLADA